MVRDDDIIHKKKHEQLAEMPGVLDQTCAIIEVSRALLNRSQRLLRTPADPRRSDEARQVVQEYIDDQKALIKKLRKEH